MEGQVHWIPIAVIVGAGIAVLMAVAVEAFLARRR